MSSWVSLRMASNLCSRPGSKLRAPYSPQTTSFLQSMHPWKSCFSSLHGLRACTQKTTRPKLLQLTTRLRQPTARTFTSGRRSYSSSSPRLTSRTLFNAILALNLIPFGIFWYGRLTDNRKLQAKVVQYSLLTPTSSPITLLSSGFFHISPFHLAFNMFTLKTMIDVLVYMSPRPAIAAVCLGTYLAGIVGGNLAMRSNFGPWKGDAHRGRGGALGASGGVTALLVAGSIVAPRMPMNIMFIPINIPLAAIAGMYLLVDAGYLNDARSSTGHAAHLGGGMVGALTWFLLLRR